jgi:hypothetical protein
VSNTIVIILVAIGVLVLAVIRVLDHSQAALYPSAAWVGTFAHELRRVRRSSERTSRSCLRRFAGCTEARAMG